ncbi:glycosyltransferase family 4 protein [Geomicrobium sp. JCM 19055]|uniref:glycosyltransferase family 4 protein n=1 Tax=Geomicrobium sp. JCM 19055 TaxID=1460649 RepID=UPI00045EDBB5|nr:glycosyltransferase family 4 protein [Geomicrobium sp. JCM 19055]GAJ97494.1 glycosyltransferase [Geomicrobium sp. JCM 19055]
MKNAAHVIAVGPALYEEIIQEYGVSEDRVSLINMGVNRNVFHQRTDVPSPFDQEKKHILFAGNIIKQKGIVELIRAFQQLHEDDQQLQLHLVGSFQSDAFKSEVENLIETLHLPKEAVLFHGPKSQDELAIHMTYADVFVLPSHIEGFGLVVLESMSCGTPVVASNVGGLPSLLSDEAGVLVEPEQPESLKRGIDAVLYDESLRKQLVQAGYKKSRCE